MTIDHPIRRFLARVISDDTMARIVDPTLADMRAEPGRPAWRGYLALARALAVHAIVSAPERARRAWREDERALPKAVLACAVTAVASTLALIAAALDGGIPPRIGALRTITLLTPQAMVLAFPLSLLVGIPLAFRRTRDRRRILICSLAIACVSAAATLAALIAVPEANQTFRVEASGQTDIRRGTMELGFRGLREQIDVLELTPGGRVAARQLRYQYQFRLTLVCAALPLGLIAGGIALRRYGRVLSLAAGVVLLVGYTYALFWIAAASSTLLTRVRALPGGPVAWLPTVVLTTLAIAIWRAPERSWK